VYLTPLYYTMAHFSKYIRPGATRIGMKIPETKLLATAAQNPDGSIAVVILNMEERIQTIELSLKGLSKRFSISPKAIQTLVIPAFEQS
jgi:glucosylceramidase